MSRYIELTKDKRVIVDDEDYEFLMQWKWCYNAGYALRGDAKNNTKILMHRVLMSTPEDMEVDHINQNKLDNTRINLRNVSISENQMNRGKYANNTSGFKGVSWHKRLNKWQVSIQAHKKTIHLGYFTAIKEAALNYNMGAIKYHGEFAVLNLIEE